MYLRLTSGKLARAYFIARIWNNLLEFLMFNHCMVRFKMKINKINYFFNFFFYWFFIFLISLHLKHITTTTTTTTTTNKQPIKKNQSKPTTTKSKLNYQSSQSMELHFTNYQKKNQIKIKKNIINNLNSKIIANFELIIITFIFVCVFI